MVSQVTIDTINLVKDIDINYNIKIFILFVLLVYFIAMFWISFKVEIDTYWWFMTRFIIRFITIPYIFFFPLFAYFLLREVSYEVLYLYMLGIYSVFLVVITLMFKVGFGEFMLKLMGLENIGPKRFQSDFKRRGLR